MSQKSQKQQTVFILSVSSDIGYFLAKKYLQEGYRVVGTYRSLRYIKDLVRNKDCHLFSCDVAKRKNVQDLIRWFRKMNMPWDAFISCVGWPKPLTTFFQGNFDRWSESVHVNALEPLRVLHGLYPFRSRRKISSVVFFAGGGVNNAVVNFSAYTASKIFLIKMCEFLDAENPDLNVFIVGPGWTRTKTHELMLRDRDISKDKHSEIISFLNSNKGTMMEDIFACIHWLAGQGKKVAGGRNFSVVHDPWKGALKGRLAKVLQSDVNMYKLRRYKNSFFAKKGIK